MKLNPINLAVTDVHETRDFLEKYFGLRPWAGGPNGDTFVLMFDDDNSIITLMKANQAVEYPASFHIGFMQETEEEVNEINERLRTDGFEVKEPRHLHGSWTFYFKAPGGFLVEVLC